MASEKNKKTEKKPSFFSRLGRWFKLLPRRIATPFVNMWRELKKVTWPSRKDLVNYTGVVIVFMIFMAVVVGLLDLGATALIDLLI